MGKRPSYKKLAQQKSVQQKPEQKAMQQKPEQKTAQQKLKQKVAQQKPEQKAMPQKPEQKTAQQKIMPQKPKQKISMKKKPEVSIVIPSFNEEKYIGAVLSSIRRQKTSISYEIIVGDGNSTDATVKIAKDHGARVIRENHGTPSGGRHEAAKMAKGKFIFFVSADVELSPTWLDNMVAVFSDKKVTWAVGRIRPFDANMLEEFGGIILNLFTITLNPLGIAYVNADNLAARADAYFKSGGFNPKKVTAEDTDLGRRLMKTGKFAFAKNATIFISMRRVRKWGYLNFILFHTRNFLMANIFSKSSEMYAPIR